MGSPSPEKINFMPRWKVAFTSRINTKFIRERVSIDDVLDQARQRYIENITHAQENGEIRPDIKPELLMLVVNTAAISGSKTISRK